MRNYSLLKAIPFSFFSKDLYRDVGMNWRGIGFLYLLTLLFLTSLPTFLIWEIKAIRVSAGEDIIDKSPELNDIINQLPNITVRNGNIFIDKPEPYYLKDKNGVTIVTIDTTGKTTGIEAGKSGVLGVLITKNQFIMAEARQHKTTIEDIPNINLSITQDKAKNTIRRVAKLLWLAPIIVSIVAFPVTFLFLIIVFLIYGLVGMLFALILKVKMEYPTLVRLAIIANTPTMIVGSVLDGFHLTPHKVPQYVWILIDMAYLFYAISANRDSRQEVT